MPLAHVSHIAGKNISVFLRQHELENSSARHRALPSRRPRPEMKTCEKSSEHICRTFLIECHVGNGHMPRWQVGSGESFQNSRTETSQYPPGWHMISYSWRSWSLTSLAAPARQGLCGTKKVVFAQVSPAPRAPVKPSSERVGSHSKTVAHQNNH